MKYFFTFFTLTAALLTLHAAPASKDVPPPPPHQPRPKFRMNQGHKPGNSHNFWRIFSRLSPAEQKEMMHLQRTDQEKFRTAIQEKVKKIQEELQAKRQKVNAIAEKIRNSKDESEKAGLRKELHAILKADFDARLAQMRRNIEANKKRIARMEADLKKREENAEAIVDAITDSVISGKKFPQHPRARKPMQK